MHVHKNYAVRKSLTEVCSKMKYSQTSIIRTSIIRNLRLSGWGFHLHFHLIRTARVKIQTSGCSILLFLVLLPGAMASIKHKKVVRTI